MYCFADACFVKGLDFHINRVTLNSGIIDHTHDFIEIVYTLKGSRTHYIDGKRVVVKRGDVLFINYGRTHSYDDGDGVMFNILLKPSFINGKLKGCRDAMKLLDEDCFKKFKEELKREDCICHLKGKPALHAQALIRALDDEYRRYGHRRECEIGSEEIMRAYMTAFLILIFREMSIIPQTKRISKGIDRRVFEYIDKHLSENISLSEVARISHYNSSYFSRRFRESTGMTFTDYVHSERIKASCEMIKATDLSIEEISKNVGYSDKTLFYREFTQRTGMSPGEYRSKKSEKDQKKGKNQIRTRKQ